MIKRLKELRDASIKYEEPGDATSWNSQLGILISRDDLDKLIAVVERGKKIIDLETEGVDGLVMANAMIDLSEALAALEEE